MYVLSAWRIGCMCIGFYSQSILTFLSYLLTRDKRARPHADSLRDGTPSASPTSASPSSAASRLDLDTFFAFAFFFFTFLGPRSDPPVFFMLLLGLCSSSLPHLIFRRHTNTNVAIAKANPPNAKAGAMKACGGDGGPNGGERGGGDGGCGGGGKLGGGIGGGGTLGTGEGGGVGGGDGGNGGGGDGGGVRGGDGGGLKKPGS